jgi:hypothetical protein
VIGSLVALVLGLLSPYLAVVPVVPIVVAFLYAYAGFAPAAACAALTLITYAISFGMTGMLMGLSAYIVPAALIVWGIRARLPFFRQIALAIASLAAGVVAALAIAYVAFDSDLLGAAGAVMKSAVESMQKAYPGFIDVIVARAYGIPGAPESVSQELLLNGFLTAAQRASYIEALLADMQTALALSLPGYLLSMAALSGVIAVAWPGYVRKSDPETDDVSYVPLAKWYTPYRLSVGMLVTLGVGYILSWQNVKGGDTVYMTIRAILFVVFMIQAAASIERRMQTFGARTWLRVVVILAIELLFGELAVYYGGASALIGSTGAVRQLMEKRANRQ